MRRLLLVGDVAALLAGFLLAQAITPTVVSADNVSARWELTVFVLSLPLWIVLMRLHGLYDRDDERSDHSTVDDFVGIFQVVTIGTFVFLAGTWLTGLAQPQFGRLLVFWIAAIVLVPATRALMRAIGRRQSAYVQRVLVVGSGRVARDLASKILKHPEYRLDVLGFVDQEGSTNGSPQPSLLGSPSDLPRLVDEFGVDRVLIAFSADSHEQTLDVVRSLQSTQVQIDLVPRLFEVVGANAQVHTLEGLPLIGLPTPRLSGSSRFLKRSLDLVGSSLGLLLLSPVFLLAAAAIKLDSRGPVFFRQVRMGAEEVPFRIFKFRTMYEDADARKAEVEHLNMHQDGDSRMFKVPDDPRVTRVGRVLRRWRIDELPQLLNVVKGEMSLVGPRPLILEEDRHVERWARKRLQLKPGITGLWQVLGASDIPFDEMTKLDYLYVTNWSLAEDLRLIFLTLPSLTRTRQAY